MGTEIVAYIVLAAFPLFAVLVFQRYSCALATSIVVVCGSILLPEKIAYDFPAVPPLDKEYITFLSLLLAAMIQRSNILRSAKPGRGLEWMLAIAFASTLGTAAMNPLPLMDEGRLEPGLSAYWVMATTGDDLLTFAIPFFLGRALIRTPKDLRTLMGTLAIGGALYLAPILVEVILSIPFRVFQLSQVIYGTPMRAQWRWGFIQPVVFMDNGLSLATFMASAAVSANGFVRAKMRIMRRRPRMIRNVILLGLALTLNVAGNLYGLALTAASSVLPPRRMAIIGGSLALFALAYPFLRILNMFPYETLVAFASDFDTERARSLEGRFLEENHVLSQIGDRIWFGWGNIARIPGAETFGRGETGLDGWWTIQLGMRGLVGVAIYFGALGIPVFLTWRRLKYVRSQAEQALLASLMAIVAMRMVDLLINGWWNDLPMFLAGALYGLARTAGKARRRAPSSNRSNPDLVPGKVRTDQEQRTIGT